MPAAHYFDCRADTIRRRHAELLSRPNIAEPFSWSGVLDRYKHPVLTAEHTPLKWRYDWDATRNPWLLDRLGVNAVFNAGAIEHEGEVAVVCRVEGVDRKSFFAVARSSSPVEGFRFDDEPVELAPGREGETNLYDMRLTRHEDGWIYGLFCTERRDPTAPAADQSSAEAQCGVARTRDLRTWQRLADVRTPSPQQRNVVLHPEFVDGRYALYTRPQDGFIDAGSGGGIGWGLCDSMESAQLDSEEVVDPRRYHTVSESKNGQGPPPIRTDAGWLHLAHGVRGTASGLRYVLYVLLTGLDEPWRVTHRPGGHVLAAAGDERLGDLHNVLFSNGWVLRDGTLCVYYASCDTRLHVATAPLERLIDYAVNTPPDPETSHGAVAQRQDLIRRNR